MLKSHDHNVAWCFMIGLAWCLMVILMVVPKMYHEIDNYTTEN